MRQISAAHAGDSKEEVNQEVFACLLTQLRPASVKMVSDGVRLIQFKHAKTLRGIVAQVRSNPEIYMDCAESTATLTTRCWSVATWRRKDIPQTRFSACPLSKHVIFLDGAID